MIPITAARNRIDQIGARASQGLPAIPPLHRPVPCVLPVDDVLLLIRLARAGLDLRHDVVRAHGPMIADAYDIEVRAAMLVTDARDLLSELHAAEREIEASLAPVETEESNAF